MKGMKCLLIVPLLIGAYICGTLNGAYYIDKIHFRKDIRELGSTTAGARNAGRVFGKGAFVGALLIDTIKTVIPLAAGFMLSFSSWMIGILALFVLIGHIWPIQLGYKGGKGIVVYLASVLVIVPVALPFSLFILITAKLLKVSFTNAGLLALIPAPVLLFIQTEWQLACFFSFMLIIVIFAHKRSVFNE
ncbi:glycerol-3-phosphate acyltransferase [Planococcus alpniumensis]|uniref:glycerol-3-phosphate acyltransferase n=1 Tax=Planococcus alpniumensis TaxID=2708345 RepID=UPI002012D3D5|nr:glycerol-3-phosphate acyltransferase [Planococcus sp. MSAK28401]